MAFLDPPFVIVVGGTSLSTGRLSGAWPSKLQRALNAVCKRRVRVIDAGKGSQTSDWAVTQIPWWQQVRADAAIIEYSINDAAPSLFGSGLAGHSANLVNIIDSLRANNPGIDITIQTMSPVGPSGSSLRPNLAGFYNLDRSIATDKAARLLDNNQAWLTYIGQMTGTTPSTQYAFPNDGSWTQANDELHPVEARVDALLLPRVISHFRSIINNELVFVGPPPGSAAQNGNYNWSPSIWGSPTGLVFSISAGALPPGMTLNTATGQITGSATTLGTYAFTVRASGAGMAGEQPCSINVTDAPVPTYRGQSRGSSTVVTKPAGVAVGDIAFVLLTYQPSTNALRAGSGAFWETSLINWNASHGYTSRMFWKVLDETDVAGSWVLGASNNYECVVYKGNGANRVTLKQTADIAQNVNSFTFDGVAKSPTHAGLVCVMDDRDVENSTYSFSGGGTWTTRLSVTSASFFWVKFADLLADYISGQGITVTGLNGTSGYGQVGWLFELDVA